MNQRILEMKDFVEHGKSDYILKKSGNRVAHTSRASPERARNNEKKNVEFKERSEELTNESRQRLPATYNSKI